MFEHIRSMLKEVETVSCYFNFFVYLFCVFLSNPTLSCKEFQQNYRRAQTFTLKVRACEEQIGLLNKRISDLAKGSYSSATHSLFCLTFI
jgi:hypothetical protein